MRFSTDHPFLSPHKAFGVARAKCTVHIAASTVAQSVSGRVAASCLNWVSYSSQGDPTKSWLALTINELYARRSLTRSGFRIAIMLMKELKHDTQSSIDVMLFLALIFSGFSNASSTVEDGAPSLDGSSSWRSMYSPCQIFSANLTGTGGELGPTATAFFDCSCVSGINDFRVVVNEKGSCSGGCFSLISVRPASSLGGGSPLMLSPLIVDRPGSLVDPGGRPLINRFLRHPA